jgi:hypothetical protein
MRRRRAVAALALLLGVLGAGPAAARSVEDAILPLDRYPPTDARVLAAEHAAELRALHADLLGCRPGLEFQPHGIAFRRPIAGDAGEPYLTVWVWVDGARPPAGADLASRAADAFHLHGQALLRRIVARSAIYADPRVGGYGLILTWIGALPRAGRVVGESLALFASRLTAATFVHDGIGPAEFLARSSVRIFDGQTELPASRLAVEDDGRVPSGPAAC